MFYWYKFYPAPYPIVFHGTQSALSEKLEETGMYVLSENNGAYLLAGNPHATIFEYSDEKAKKFERVILPHTELLYCLYDIKRITEKDYKRLIDDLNNGLVSFDSLKTSKVK